MSSRNSAAVMCVYILVVESHDSRLPAAALYLGWRAGSEKGVRRWPSSDMGFRAKLGISEQDELSQPALCPGLLSF